MNDNAGARWMLRCGRRNLSLERVALMGVLNVTPDSFSDGGRFVSPQQAVAHAISMVNAGAAIIDIGGESTRPGAEPVDETEEWRRIEPVLRGVRERSDVFISVDTTKAAIAARALQAGADIINDVSGGWRETALLDEVARAGAGIILMHMRGTPQTMAALTRYNDIVAEVRGELGACAQNALEHGIGSDSIVLDPGIGFAKDAVGSLILVRELKQLAALGYPLLVGPSRKSFIGAALGGAPVAHRQWGTAAAVALAVAGGARIVRVHDVAEMADVVRMTEAILSGQIPEHGKQ